MLRHWFAQPVLLWGLLLLPTLGLLAAWSEARRRVALARLGPGVLPNGLLTVRPWPRRLRSVCLALGLLAVTLGAAGPQWGRETGQTAAPGRDLVVVVDCSRSMLAETPSRLARSQAAVLDLADEVQRHGGHRLALVAFAARPRLLCPLTHDYDHFRAAAATLTTLPGDPDLAPAPGQPSGTRIGLALQVAVRLHDSRFRGARDVLLLSDGDDPARDGEWEAGIAAAAAERIPVYSVGVGDPDRPRLVPGEDGALTDEGKDVRSRLEEEPLRAIARETGGVYFPARTATLPLGRLYLDRVANQPLREDSDDALPTYRQHPLWFLLPAFALLAASVLIPEGAGRPPARKEEGP